MKVFNTLSGQKEEFVPQGDEVTVYVCGINPYADAHIGHAMSYVFFDVVRRYLEFRGYKVKHVQNVTDIEDNIIAHANKLGVSVPELTQKYVERYEEDMKALNVLPAHGFPRAMGAIDKMIEIVQGLIEKGFAYAVSGNVYFRVRNVPDYGKLSGRSLEQMMAGARIEPGEDKEHPMDFLLWKESKPDEPSWDSPWGKGRPGWHIECSAMSIRDLGEQIDIHGGGQDVLFPHHENEIAQSESFTGKKPFVKYWLHNGLLKMHETDEAKMSRSLGNLITIREALEKYSADAIRIFVLSSYYRSPLTYSEETLEAAERGAERLRQAASRIREGNQGEAQIDMAGYRNRFIEVMDDDFSTAQALATLFDLAREINRADETGMDVSKACDTLVELAGVLGLTLKEPEALIINPDYVGKLVAGWESVEQNLATIQTIPDEAIRVEIGNVVGLIDRNIESIKEQLGENVEGTLVLANEVIKAQVDLRTHLRVAKQFQLADEIRDGLGELGITLEDTSQGTVWKRKR
ncbi:MAG: cysteine--tRNA ligase [Dehalococcoidales bacterium]|nr:MAG: cysteine--tRNA ligase [Dehalococcoidales bacterium]